MSSSPPIRRRPFLVLLATVTAAMLTAACGSSRSVIIDSAPWPGPTGRPTVTTGPTLTTRPTVTTGPTTVVDPNQPAHPADPAAARALADARARWKAAGLHDYGYRLRIGCFCPPGGPWAVRVVGDVPATVTDTAHIELGAPDHPPATLRSVPGMFDEIERALTTAGSITVSYDPAVGFPSDVGIDWITNAVDDEVRWSVTVASTGASGAAPRLTRS